MPEIAKLWRTASLALLIASLGAGCAGRGIGGAKREEVVVGKVAVMPLRELVDGTESVPGEPPNLANHAGIAVTAQIYRILAAQSRIQFVPDLAVQDEMWAIHRETRDQLAAARLLAERSGARGVIFGTVYRFRERVGTKWAASSPASVSFDLALYAAEKDEVYWKGSFERTQESLSRNLFDWWMFWRAGPHWFTARELAGLGIDKLMDDMLDSIP